MDPMLAEFAQAVARVEFAEPSIPVIATAGGALNREYWVRQVREPVRFADAVAALGEAGVTRVVELGPDGSLTAAVGEILPDAVAVPVLRRDRDEEQTALRALAALHVTGAPVDWAAFLPAASVVDLPTYPFQRERFWPAAGTSGTDAAGLGLVPVDHPLLGAAVLSAEDGAALVTGRLSVATQPWLADHVVGGAVLFPGTGFLELVLRAADQVGCDRVEDLTIAVPLVLPEREQVAVQVSLGVPDDAGRREVRVYSRPAHLVDGEWTRHATGLLGSGERVSALDTTQWPPPDTTPVDLDGHYARLEANGLRYGPVFRGLRQVWRRGEEIFAEVALPERLDGRSQEAGAFGLHPALLDAALQASAFLAANEGRNLMPFSWRGVSLHAAGASALRVHWTGAEEITLAAVDPAGAPVISVEALTLRPAPAQPATAPDTALRDALFRVDWPIAPTATAPVPGRTVAVLDTVAGLLTDQPPEIALLPVVGHKDGPTATTARVLDVLHEWLAEPRLTDTRLVVVTRGAVAGVDSPVTDLAASAVWGLVRSAQSEHPGRFALVDVESDEDVALALPVLDDEPQVIVREGVARVARLARVLGGGELVPPPEGPWRLDTRDRGSLDGLALLPSPEAAEPLRGAQVRLRVTAAGLNFRDVLTALGMYPGEPGALGAEAAGVVLEVGPDAAALRPGDRVMGIVPGGMGSVAVVPDERVLVKAPAGWSDETAASIPLVFLTALYALTDLGQVRPGDRVLVHAGAGGVGMAAIQLAHHLGAEVFATAGESKWETLRSLGVAEDHIASSRTLEFEQVFGAVDVVLNSLAGEFV
ncbi:hypothetical protein BU204_36230, partial [Actinophytocola xanthii]